MSTWVIVQYNCLFHDWVIQRVVEGLCSYELNAVHAVLHECSVFYHVQHHFVTKILWFKQAIKAIQNLNFLWWAGTTLTLTLHPSKHGLSFQQFTWNQSPWKCSTFTLCFRLRHNTSSRRQVYFTLTALINLIIEWFKMQNPYCKIYIFF